MDLELGAKVTGRVGRWNIGVLDIQQDEFQGVDSTKLFVGRLSANILAESSIGMIVTNGDPRNNLDNSLFGMDFRYRNTRLPGGARWKARRGTSSRTPRARSAIRARGGCACRRPIAPGCGARSPWSSSTSSSIPRSDS